MKSSVVNVLASIVKARPSVSVIPPVITDPLSAVVGDGIGTF